MVQIPTIANYYHNQIYGDIKKNFEITKNHVDTIFQRLVNNGLKFVPFLMSFIRFTENC